MRSSKRAKLSIILPAKNEADNLEKLLPEIKKEYSEAEVIVVDDGSSDDTIQICNLNHVAVISHPYSKGNGAAIKSGVRSANGETIIFMDADGQHNVSDISSLINHIDNGYDMVVGKRDSDGQASQLRWIANTFYNWFASIITGQYVGDLTSGFRAVRAKKFREFLYLLPNGFSYPSTITMAFFRAGYSVAYVEVSVKQRAGRSHIKPLQDGARFLLIIFRVATLYSPLKIFAPISFVIFMTGIGYYVYTYLADGRFTNMGTVLFLVSVILFLIGLISEQISTLLYATATKKD